MVCHTTCPINQLPPEILRKIFLHSIAASAQEGDIPQHLPQLLALVCKQWHALALALPALWASLHIKCDFGFTHLQVIAIHTHLQHSKTHPLTFWLHSHSIEHLYHATTPYISAALLALGAARERWQCVAVTLAVAQQATIDALTLGSIPLLREFDCNFLQVQDEQKPALIPLFAPHACPLLESLSWTGFRGTPVHQPASNTMWMHLTSLCIDALLSVTNCLTLLRLSPRLSTAQLGVIDLPLTRAPLPHLVHHTLHTLRAEGSQTTALLSALTLPALTHLRLEEVPFTHTFHTGARTGLHACFARSAPPLLKLTLDNAQLSEPDLLRALALVPTLLSLSIQGYGTGGVRLTAALIHALHPAPSSASSGTEALCPRLHTLYLSDDLECPDGACGAMLRARWGENARANGVAVLQHASIELPEDANKVDHEVRDALCEQGMKWASFSG